MGRRAGWCVRAHAVLGVVPSSAPTPMVGGSQRLLFPVLVFTGAPHEALSLSLACVHKGNTITHTILTHTDNLNLSNHNERVLKLECNRKNGLNIKIISRLLAKN